ncbi:unnamed protein product, partial [Prorocentrum cordatum]
VVEDIGAADEVAVSFVGQWRENAAESENDAPLDRALALGPDDEEGVEEASATAEASRGFSPAGADRAGLEQDVGAIELEVRGVIVAGGSRFFHLKWASPGTAGRPLLPSRVASSQASRCGGTSPRRAPWVHFALLSSFVLCAGLMCIFGVSVGADNGARAEALICSTASRSHRVDETGDAFSREWLAGRGLWRRREDALLARRGAVDVAVSTAAVGAFVAAVVDDLLQ